MSNLTDRLGGTRSSLAVKAPVRCATTAAITLAGFQTIDGQVLADGDENLRVLVRAQDDAKDNGLYIAQSGNWQRAKDFKNNGDFVKGTQLSVVEGSLYENSVWILTSTDPIIIGASDITFEIGSEYDADSLGVVQPGDDAVVRTATSKLLERITPEDFGAVGDGTTDDDVALQAALTYAGDNGLTLTIPSKTYLSGTMLVVPDGASIIGEGAATIKATGTLTKLMQCGPTAGSSTYTIHIDNLLLHGNSTCSTAVLALRNLSQSIFRRVRTTSGAATGVSIDASLTLTGEIIGTKSIVDAELGPATDATSEREFYIQGTKVTSLLAARSKLFVPQLLYTNTVAAITALSSPAAGWHAFATNGRKNGEGAGSGTGVVTFYDGVAWRACDTGATLAA